MHETRCAQIRELEDLEVGVAFAAVTEERAPDTEWLLLQTQLSWSAPEEMPES